MSVLALLALEFPSGSLAAAVGQISGKVTATSTEAPIAGIEVCASPKNVTEPPPGPPGGPEEGPWCATSAASGEYTIANVPAGEYMVRFGSALGGLGSSTPLPNYIPQFYNDKSSESEANAVSVTAGAPTAGINAKLVEGGRITGKVTNAATGAALEKVLVCAFTANPEGVQCAQPNASGEYSIVGLTSGEYKVGFGLSEFVTQYYNDKPALAEANPVSVTLGKTVSGVDAALAPKPPAPPTNKTPPEVIELPSSPPTGPPGGLVTGTSTPGANAPLSPAVGATLWCLTGVWNGIPIPTYSYKWLRDGAPIAGATQSKYAVQAADSGHTLVCEVTAKNTLGEQSAKSPGVTVKGGTGPGGSGASSKQIGGAGRVAIRSRKILVSRHARRIRVEITCLDAPCSGTVELIVRALRGRRAGGRGGLGVTGLLLAKGTFALAHAGSAAVMLRLTPAGKRWLAHAARHPRKAILLASPHGATQTDTPVLVR